MADWPVQLAMTMNFKNMLKLLISFFEEEHIHYAC